ncbi:methyltransferase domain-containing protein [Glaciecola sp. 1036]|uniref:methyltransferase domain-containing protein n=1 Tax=Alteromonadaceae TaxID=72275 RepID=UPI003D06F7C1
MNTYVRANVTPRLVSKNKIENEWLLANKIASGFDRAANQYDEFGLIQKQVSQHLTRLIACQSVLSGIVLDIGCGTGALASLNCNPNTSWINLDLSQQMLKVAKTKLENNGEQNFVQANADNLPLLDSSVDNIVSSMALQWCKEPAKTLSELARVLKPNGDIWLAIMVESSFSNLHMAWENAGYPSKINTFPDEIQWTSLLPQSLYLTEKQSKVFRFIGQDFKALLSSITAVGASTSLQDKKPLQKTEYLKLKQAYSALYADHYYLDYHVVFARIKKQGC